MGKNICKTHIRSSICIQNSGSVSSMHRWKHTCVGALTAPVSPELIPKGESVASEDSFLEKAQVASSFQHIKGPASAMRSPSFSLKGRHRGSCCAQPLWLSLAMVQLMVFPRRENYAVTTIGGGPGKRRVPRENTNSTPDKMME